MEKKKKLVTDIETILHLNIKFETVSNISFSSC